LSGSWVLAVLLLFSVVELLRARKGEALPPMSRKAVVGGTALYVFLFVLFPLLGLVSAAASKNFLAAPIAAPAEFDPAQSTLPDEGCGREGNIRSVASTEPTEITFINHGTVPLNVYWLNYQGTRAFYATLAPGRGLVQQSHAPNPWLIAVGPSGDCIAIVRAARSSGTVVVRATAE